MGRVFGPHIQRYRFTLPLAFLVLASCSDVRTLNVNPAEISLSSVGQTLQIDAEPLTNAGIRSENATVTFVSRHPSVATVSTTGLVSAVSHGVTTVVVQVEGTDIMEFVRIIVRIADRIEIRPTSTTVYIGDVKTLKAKVLDRDGKAIGGVNFVWKSPDTKVATVESGKVTGIDEGQVEITASSLGLKGSSKITVSWSPKLRSVLEAEKRAKKRGSGRRRGSGGGRNSEWDPRLGIFDD